MTDLLIMIRNVVLATILGWIGIEFAPNADKEEKPGEKSSIVALLG